MRLHAVHDDHATPHGRFPQVQIEIVRGRARRKLREAAPPMYLIGSADDCDLVLAEPRFPDVHTYLFIRPDEVFLRTLGAGPELTLDAQPVKSAALRDGQRIRTGPFEFRVHIRWPDKTDAPKTCARKAPREDEVERYVVESNQPAGILAAHALIRDIRAQVVLGRSDVRLSSEKKREIA